MSLSTLSAMHDATSDCTPEAPNTTRSPETRGASVEVSPERPAAKRVPAVAPEDPLAARLRPLADAGLTARHERDERVDVEEVDLPIVVEISETEVAIREQVAVRGRIGDRQHERVDVKEVDRAVAVQVTQ